MINFLVYDDRVVKFTVVFCRNYDAVHFGEIRQWNFWTVWKAWYG